MRIPHQLVLGYVGIGAAVAGIALWGAGSVDARRVRLGRFHAASLNAAQAMLATANSALEEGYSYLVGGEPEERIQFEERIRDLDQDLARFDRLFGAPDPDHAEERALTRQAISAAAGLREQAERAFAARVGGRIDKETLDELELRANALLADLTMLVANEQAQSDAAHEEALRAIDGSSRLVRLTALVAIVACGVVGWRFGRRLSGPLLELRDASARVGRGELDVAVGYRGKDELGEVAEAFRSMAASVRRLLDERAEVDRRLHQSEKLASVGRIAAGIAHEIGNPLAYVASNLSYVRAQLERGAAGADPGSELSSALREAIEGTERIGEIIRSMQALSRGQQVRGTAAIVELGGVLDRAVRMTRHGIARRARLVLEGDGAPPVLGDEGQLTQLFVNLLANAADAIPEGRPDANEIRIVSRADGDGRAVIEVRDTGEGVPESVRARLFEPFFTTKPVGSGMGLGLSISHGIAQVHGGTIEVESEPGRGSCFRVVLPRAPVGAAA